MKEECLGLMRIPTMKIESVFGITLEVEKFLEKCNK